MKIYQLHKYTGVWEDFRDTIIGSYLRRERAEEEKNKAEIKEKELTEQNEKCFECPFIGEDNENLNSLLSEYSNYCTKVKLNRTEYGIINCDNYYTHWDDATFSVKEVEVEE